MRLMVAVLIALGVVFVGAHFQPCPHEDSIGCTWYADTQGNGKGETSIHWYTWSDLEVAVGIR